MRREKKFNLLWITPKWPLPANDGARIATVNLLRGLNAAGVTIDLLALPSEDEVIDEGEAREMLGVKSVSVVPRAASRRAALARWTGYLGDFMGSPSVPLTMSSYAKSDIRKALARCIERFLKADSSSAKYIVYDGLHPAIHQSSAGRFRPVEAADIKVIYRAHNHETRLWEQKSGRAANPLAKAFFRYQAGRVRELENSLIEHSAGVAAVSPQDLASLRNEQPQLSGRVVPIGCDCKELAPPPAAGVQVLFLGRLDWLPNREGLRWFLERVWPKAVEKRPELRLVIAGSGDGDWLKKYLHLPQLSFLGRVERVEKLYAESHLSLVPIFWGSGTRVKVIEASSLGRPCLSTALGVEGTGLVAQHSYLQAESEEEWIATLVQCSPAHAAEIGRAAYGHAVESFSLMNGAREFVALLEGADSNSRPVEQSITFGSAEERLYASA